MNSEDNITEVEQSKPKFCGGKTSAISRLTEIAINLKLGKHKRIESLKELHHIQQTAENEENRQSLSDQLAKEKLGAVWKRILMNSPKFSEEYKLTLKILADYSRCSGEIRLELGRVGVLSLLVQELRNNLHEKVLPKECEVLFVQILYNCATESENKKILKTKKASEVLINYENSEDETVKMLVILILSHVIGEAGDAVLVEDSLVANILHKLNEAMATASHQSGGWTAVELISGIKNLSGNRQNSLLIVKKGGLITLQKVIMEGRDVLQSLATDTIWMLAFQDENKTAIQKYESLMATLKSLAEKPGAAQESARGTLWLLEKKAKAKFSTASNKPHIMISYQWDNQELLARIYEELAARGFKIWMDIHSMSGSILGAMANAVENAELLLIGMSQKYEDSANCRTEAEYAFSLKKKIIPIKAEQDYTAEGWLGALVGTKLYINFSSVKSYEGEKFNSKIAKLVVEIERAGVKRENAMTRHISKEPAYGSKNGETSNKKQLMEEVRPRMQDEAVKKWIEKHSLSLSSLTSLTSIDIEFLAHLKNQGPHTFYKFLAGDIPVEKLREISKAAKAVEDFTIKQLN